MSEKLISASEVGDFVYCNRSWWLRHIRGFKPGNQRQLALGTQHHQQHGKSVQQIAYARKIALILLFAAVAFLAFWVLN